MDQPEPPLRYAHLITAPELQQLLASGQAVHLFDCSFDLAAPAEARSVFESIHIDGASFVDLDHDLSEHQAGKGLNGGRHPLPQKQAVAARLRELGLNPGQQAVVYDRSGSMFCVRLWWMLKWLGHESVAVLDGGLQAWQAIGGATRSGPAPYKPAGSFQPGPELRHWIDLPTLQEQLEDPARSLIDARANPRYQGLQEPLDPVAGHIPGALNRPFTENFDVDGHFKPAGQLRSEFLALLKGRDPDQVTHHCGSGVTATPNLLAMELAGFAPGTLYAGGWSEWSRTPGLPIARGSVPHQDTNDPAHTNTGPAERP